MGWGTHEKELPLLAYEHADGPRNQICLARMGINTWVRSWVPHYTIQGMVVRHGEAFTISDYLTVWEDGRPVYRPTVHYAYCPSDCGLLSLQELRGNNYRLQSKQRIMTDEITGGSDILGGAAMGHAFKSWWTGSDLSIEESRRLVPHQNATTMQVATSVVAAVMWMIENPGRVCSPEDLPHDYVLPIAEPYLGRNLSLPADWTPLSHRHGFFDGYADPSFDLEDPWQFKNFLVTERGGIVAHLIRVRASERTFSKLQLRPQPSEAELRRRGCAAGSRGERENAANERTPVYGRFPPQAVQARHLCRVTRRGDRPARCLGPTPVHGRSRGAASAAASRAEARHGEKARKRA